MDKKTGMIVSIVGSVVALCLALACCGGGIGWGIQDPDNPSILLIVGGICLGLFPIIGAVLLWVFLVIRAKDEGAAEVMPPMDI
jgi:hypothetical protein